MLPTLRQLQYLKLLVEQGSFSRAAEAAHVTQPTLSAGIAELEKIIGAPVVDRARSGMILTAAGHEAAARASDILAKAEDLVQAAQGAGQPLSGRFRLGVIPTIAPFLLPRALPALRARFPKLRLYLREDLMRTRMGRSMASLAGPGGTLAVLLTLSLILFVMGRAGWTGKALYPALAFLAYLQATALVLNLIPVPGLDGYGVVRPFLPDGVRKALRPVEPIAFLAVFAAIFLVPQVGQGLFDIAGLVAYVLGVPLDAAQAGMDAFRFWKH